MACSPFSRGFTYRVGAQEQVIIKTKNKME